MLANDMQLMRKPAAALPVLLFLTCPLWGNTMEQRLPTVVEVFTHLKTVCVGRFLIDVPATAELSYGEFWAPYKIVRIPGGADKLKSYLGRFEQELDSRRHLASKELRGPESMLGKVIEGPIPGLLHFMSMSRGYYGFYHIQSLLPVGNDLFIQSATPLRGDDYLNTIKILNDVARRLEARSDEMPTKSGFCIDGALIVDAAKSDVEKIQFGVRLKEYDDVHFSVEMTRKDYVVESDALEPRVEQARRDGVVNGFGNWYSKIAMFRKGKRSLGPWSGFEVLARVPPQKGKGEGHDFNFVALGIPKDPLAPTIDMKLDTGVRGNRPGAVKPSVTDEEALYIWDRITTSIRLRPVTPVK
jgi:Tle cognate immunity protein 4 C-terminal domain/Tle cognate immunity protein 4 N-terminal domain